ncbi:MAG: GGDEF domain-containing protein, partial [Gammaproteobacteria bacterium]
MPAFKLNISVFSLLVVVGMTLAMFLLWCVSLLVIVDRQNMQDAASLRQNLHGQVLQLQQKQRLWLQSQYYLLNTLAETSSRRGNFHTFLWDYYQRNPSIWSVNLVEFDARGNPISRSSKPGCLQPAQMRREDFDDYLLPEISSCRIDDKALLEIAGPVSSSENAVVLLVSMDYFDFLNEFSTLTGRRLQRVTDSGDGFIYEEFGLHSAVGAVSIPVGNSDGVTGEVRLALQPLSFWGLFAGQALVVIAVLAGLAVLALLLLQYNLIGPLLTLAEKMRVAANSQQDSRKVRAGGVGLGLRALNEYFAVLQKMAKRDPVTGLNNRVIFEDHLAQAIREGKRSGRRYALVMIDIRGLEEFAMQRGQYIVDGLLRQVANGLREALRETDHVARFERNLFALLLEVQQREQLNTLVEKIYLSVVR